MRLIKQRGPFRAIEISFEDLSLEEIRLLQRSYHRVSLLTHHPIEGLQGFRCRHKKTPNIYVDEHLEVVFSRFRDTVRNEINRTLRMSDFEVHLPEVDHAVAYAVYREFEYGQGRAPISFDEFKSYILASAYYQGKLISGISFFQEKNTIRIRSIYSLRLQAKQESSKELYKIIGYASKRLVFELCTYAKEHGAKLVDLASINLIDADKEPIARFKSGFGAQIEDEYQYIYNTPVYRWAESLAALRARMRVTVQAWRKALWARLPHEHI